MQSKPTVSSHRIVRRLHLPSKPRSDSRCSASFICPRFMAGRFFTMGDELRSAFGTVIRRALLLCASATDGLDINTKQIVIRNFILSSCATSFSRVSDMRQPVVKFCESLSQVRCSPTAKEKQARMAQVTKSSFNYLQTSARIRKLARPRRPLQR